MRKRKIRFRGASSVVGNLLLVAIVFMMGAMFAGLVLTNDYDPNPNATIDIEQTNTCDKEDGGCLTDVSVAQMDNADYVLVTYRASPGSTVPSFEDIVYEGESPGEVDNVPNDSGDTATLGSGSASRGIVLVGAGDKVTIESDVGTDIFVYAGLDGYEDLVVDYSVQANDASFNP